MPERIDRRAQSHLSLRQARDLARDLLRDHPAVEGSAFSVRLALGYPSRGATVPPVDQYDCIVIDECHRGYTHDRELSDDELTFKDELDYLSKYRRVLEYFDAVKLALTATPAPHTTDIFGMSVYTYGYRDAVIDGYLGSGGPSGNGPHANQSSCGLRAHVEEVAGVQQVHRGARRREQHGVLRRSIEGDDAADRAR